MYRIFFGALGTVIRRNIDERVYSIRKKNFIHKALQVNSHIIFCQAQRVKSFIRIVSYVHLVDLGAGRGRGGATSILRQKDMFVFCFFNIAS